MKPSGRVLLAPAYLLHQMPWRDSSRILEFFTRDHGRIGLFARGVRRPKSAVGSVLLPFQPLLISWTGRGEAGNFIGAELDASACGGIYGLPPHRVMSGFYMNELLLKLLGRHDSHPLLFDHYSASLMGLKSASSEARILRIFEKRLLEELGYGLDLQRESGGGAALDPAGHYHYRPERGIARALEPSPGTYPGSSIQSLAHEVLDDETSQRDARRLLREALAQCLDGRSLQSREVMVALKQYIDHIPSPANAGEGKGGGRP